MNGTVRSTTTPGTVSMARRVAAFALALTLTAELVPAQAMRGMLPTRTTAAATTLDGAPSEDATGTQESDTATNDATVPGSDVSISNESTTTGQTAEPGTGEPGTGEPGTAEPGDTLTNTVPGAPSAQATDGPTATSVAHIGNTYYETLQEAFDAAVAQQPTATTITLYDADGDGRVVDGGGALKRSNGATATNVTLDLAGLTYVVTGDPVGSTGTVTQGLHLERGNTVTVHNGTLTSAADSGVLVLIQNYSDLTLRDVTLDGTQLGTGNYVLSSNAGNTLITGATNVMVPEGGTAFDVYYWPNGGYGDGVRVTVDTTGTIAGRVELASDGTTAAADTKNELVIMGGTFTGTVVGQDGGYNPDNVSVSGGTYANAIPESWVADGYTLVETDGGYAVVPASVATLPADVSVTYDGQEHVITFDESVVATVNGTPVERLAATDAGTYTASVVPAAGYTWTEGEADTEARTVTLTIAPKELTDANVELAGVVIGDELPVPVVSDGNETLVEGSDYTVAYRSVAGGSGVVVVVSGIGNYAGTVEREVEVDTGVDKEALMSALGELGELVNATDVSADGSDVATDRRYVNPAIARATTGVLRSAGLVAGDAGATQEQVNAAVEMLASVRGVFEDAMRYGTLSPQMRISSHVQNVGWQKAQTVGGTASEFGTTGRSLRLEALELALTGTAGYSGWLEADAHVQRVGWQGVRSTALDSAESIMVGTEGDSRRMEAVRLSLGGEVAEHYDIVYRAHVQNIGWTDWVKNGETAGTEGQGLRMEALEVYLVKKPVAEAA